MNLSFSELRWTVLIHLFPILLLIEVIKQICVFVLLKSDIYANRDLNPLYRCEMLPACFYPSLEETQT